VIVPPPMSYDRATGRLEGATAVERCAALAFAVGSKASSPMHYRGFSIGARVIRSLIDQREIVVMLNEDARFAFPFGDGYWSLLLDRSFVYEDEIEGFLRAVADVDYTFIDGGANFGFWSVLASSRPFGGHPVIAIEASSANAAKLARNAELNNVTNIEFVVNNAFDLLRDYDDAGERFDTIVLDPPAFAKNRGAVEAALRGYKEINLRALRLLNPGGVLITCSCSYHVSEALFLDMLAEAARDAGRPTQIVEKRAQSRDHPILLTVPETYYLKCIVARVMD